MKTIKTTTILILAILSLSSIPLALFVIAEPAFVIPEYEAVSLDSGLAGKTEIPVFSGGDFYGASPSGSGLHTSTPPVGTTVYDWYVNAISGNPDLNLRGIGDFIEVWVQDDLSFPTGDPRNADPDKWQITDDMVNYIIEEFDDTIYAIVAGYYGAPDDRDGTNTLFEDYGWPPFTYDWIETENPQRVILKIINYQDENYFNPSYPSYVAGFFSGGYTGYYNRNMVHLDCWEWVERLGEEGHQWIADRPDLIVDRPNLYESVLAHEFQHNIHRDYVDSPPIFMNEACSLFAEPLCGYELDLGQVEWFLATPDNSLTEWEDQGGLNILADYGAAFLWALFLTDHYGIDFMGRYVQNGGGGIEGVNALLPKGKNFDKVYRDWRIANLLQTDHGKYGYSLKQLRKYYNPGAEIPWDDLEPLKIHEVSGPEVPMTSAAVAFGETFGKAYIPYGETDPVQDPTGMFKLPAYGTDYIKFTNFDKEANFFFDGDEYGEVPLDAYETWSNIGDETDFLWYSGDRDLTNSLIATQIDVPTTNPILEIDTYWDIEDYWDFGFVQVSYTGDWDDWTSLEHEATTYDHDDEAHPDVIANLPGLTSWSAFYFDHTDFDRLSFDLSAYAGDTIYVGFRYVTDWATVLEGWYLDEVLVKGDEVADLDITKDLVFFYFFDPEADFTVDLIIFKEKKNGELKVKKIIKVKLKDLTEFGTKKLKLRKDEFFIAVVSANTGLVDYKFSTTGKKRRRC